MGKACDGASVGVLVTDERGRVLIGTRVDGAGVAPIAGHVFDEHTVTGPDGTRDADASYERAAVAEVAEEAGMDVVPGSLEFVAGGLRLNRCRRGDGPDGPGHDWRIYTARATGTPHSADGKVLALHFADRVELDALMRRTIDRARGFVSDSQWWYRPGLEPVWCLWLVATGFATMARTDLELIEECGGTDSTDSRGAARGATCPEHGDLWSCGCAGCDAALTARYGVYGAEGHGGR